MTIQFLRDYDVLERYRYTIAAAGLLLLLAPRLPNADPYMFPLVSLLAAFGLVMIYRIDEDLARQQAGWFLVGIVFFVGTVVLVRDIDVLERYRYVIAATERSSRRSAR